MPESLSPHRKKVFIVYGRNEEARQAVERFLESLKLVPWSFPQIARDLGMNQHTSDIVKKGMDQAHGIIALFTPEEFATLHRSLYQDRDEEIDRQRWQARPNVIFEAGMAYGTAPERTVLLMMGPQVKLFSDVAAIPYLVLSDDPESREAFRDRLIGIGCDVDQRTTAWLKVDISCRFETGVQTVAVAGAAANSGTGGIEWTEKSALQGDRQAIKDLNLLGSEKTFDILSTVIRTNPDEETRQAAIVAMAALNDDRKIDVLGEILVTEKWLVAKACAETLGRTRNPRTEPYLIRAIELNVDWLTTQKSAEALGLLPPTPASLRALVRALNLGSFPGTAAKQSLVNFGLVAAPALRENLRRDLKGEALRLTVEALQLIRAKEALPDLRELDAKTTDPAQKRCIQDAIATLSESAMTA